MSDKDRTPLSNNLLKQLYEEAQNQKEHEISLPLYENLSSNLNRYQNAVPLANGAMKQVNKVFDRKTNRHVAMANLIKYKDHNLYEPFLREAMLTSCLDHPNIITVYDIGVLDNGQPFFTMELKVGFSLESLLSDKNNNNIPLSTHLEIFLKICDATAYAHSQGVLHLDLKPSNIQVGDYGEVLVCDWGLGKTIKSKQVDIDQAPFNADLLNHLTLNGEIKGTPGYMAPEQTNPDGKKTVQTDIYSLGCILYTMLCKTPPLKGNTKIILKKTQAGEIIMPRLRFPNHNIPKGLNAVVEKAMSQNPDDRYDNIGELSNEVHNYIEGYATLAENAGFIKEFQLFFKRNLLVNLVVLFSLISLLILSILFLLKHDQQRRNALTALDKADKALVLYSNEKKNSDNISKKYSEFIVEQNSFYPKKMNYKNIQSSLLLALERINVALTNTPADKKLLNHKFNVLFIMQNFRGCIKLFQKDLEVLNKHSETKIKKNIKKKTINPQYLLYKLAQKYVQHKNENTLLSAKILSHLLLEINNIKKQQVNRDLILYDCSTRENFADYNLVLKEYFKKLQKKDSTLIIQYDHEEMLLTLSGKTIDQNVWNYCNVLTNLPVKKLDISHTNIHNYRDIIFKNIEYLDIRNSLFRNLSFLKGYKHLKKVIITPGQFPNPRTLKKFSAINFVEKKLD